MIGSMILASGASATVDPSPVNDVFLNGTGSPYYTQLALDLQDVAKIPIPGDWGAIDAIDHATESAAQIAARNSAANGNLFWARSAARVLPSSDTLMAAGRAIAIRAGVYAIAYDIEGTIIRHYKLEVNLFGGCVSYCASWTPTVVGNDISSTFWVVKGTDIGNFSTTTWPAADNSALPCGAAYNTNFQFTCATNNMVLSATSSSASTNGDGMNADLWCSISASAAQSWNGNCWSPAAQFTPTQSANAVYFWNVIKAAVESGATLYQASANVYSNGQQGKYGVYLTPAQWHSKTNLVEQGGGKQGGDITLNYTRPTITNTDIHNGAGALTGEARRWEDCQLAPSSAGCTNPATDGGATTTVPSTTTVAISGGFFIPFRLPEPTEDMTFQEYLDELRSRGWTGTATVTDDTTSTYPALSPETQIQNGAITSVTTPTAIGTPIAVYDPTTGNRNAWPTTPPQVLTADQPITLIKKPGTISLCNSCAINWAPIESIDYGSHFPFGVGSYAASLIGSLNASPSCGGFTINKPAAIGGGTQSVSLCSSEWSSTWRPIYFPIVEALMTLAAILWLGGKITGMGSGEEG